MPRYRVPNGEKIEQLRGEKGFSRPQLALLAKCSEDWIYKVERVKKPYEFAKLEVLADKLGIGIENVEEILIPVEEEEEYLGTPPAAVPLKVESPTAQSSAQVDDSAPKPATIGGPARLRKIKVFFIGTKETATAIVAQVTGIDADEIELKIREASV